jgi:hypothetical protein
MTGSVALDVVIGLVFVYLLYSLLTTTVTEIVAAWLQLRAKFLAKGIRRMLDDGSGNKIFSDAFFRQPLIKYLAPGKLKISNKPAYLSAQNFSKNLIEVFKEKNRNSLAEKRAVAIENINGERDKIKLKLTELLREDEVKKRKEQIEGLNNLIDNAKNAVNTKKEKVRDLRKKIKKSKDVTTLETEIEENEEEIKKLEEEIKQHEEEIKAKKNEEKDLHSLIKLLENSVIEWKAQHYITIQVPDEKKILEELKKPVYASYQQSIKTVLTNNKESLKEEEAKLTARPLVDKLRNVLEDTESDIALSETVRFICALLDDAQNDLEKFKASLEQWYDDTMERVTGWYKRRTQIINFFVGLGIAVAFNADTLSIVSVLSKDTNARAQMVQLASAYIEKPPAPQNGNPPGTSTKDPALDSLLQVRKVIEKDIQGANSILGLGWDFPDSLILFKKEDSAIMNKDILPVNVFSNEKRFILLTGKMNAKMALKLLEHDEDSFLTCLLPIFFKQNPEALVIGVNSVCTKVSTSKWKLFWTSFWGYVLTAIALSLGAPFWFDLLNKLVNIRSTVQPTSQSPATAQEGSQDKSIPVGKREG